MIYLAKHSDLNNPEAIKEFIAFGNWCDGGKKNLAFAYDKYVKFYNLHWIRPVYKPEAKLPRIPLEKHIDMIIANSPLKLATAISISKDTGLRPIEAMNLRLKEIDLENRIVYPTTAKNGIPRTLKFKNSTLKLLLKYLAKKNLGINDRVFQNWNSGTYSKWFRYHRNRLADKLNEATIKTIRLYDLRHFFATMLYHRTRDILLVKSKLGHKKITTTLIYTQLINFTDEEYTCRVAINSKEAKALIEQGFEYVVEIDGERLFRKRK